MCQLKLEDYGVTPLYCDPRGIGTHVFCYLVQNQWQRMQLVNCILGKKSTDEKLCNKNLEPGKESVSVEIHTLLQVYVTFKTFRGVPYLIFLIDNIYEQTVQNRQSEREINISVKRGCKHFCV